ncbi:hypothetical protein L6452_17123 [Arctium lappa]|uniref:Uncharacterized protein n=1 Tax=Arctium lappa TaxID=4217 RepID=A0ACB9C2J3_ARCLA|nr:hypothetical protein L6452_17123 [Arctium lappa]
MEAALHLGESKMVMAEAASSSTTGTPVEPIEAVVKKSGGCESQEQEVWSSDPSKKDSDACDEKGSDVDVAAEMGSSSTKGTSVEPIEAVVRESGGCESQEQEVRSSDPSKKDSNACDEICSDVDVPEKSPTLMKSAATLKFFHYLVEEKKTLVLIFVNLLLIDVEKTKAKGGSTF